MQEFLFVLTSSTGDRLWGFCRQSLPPPPMEHGVRKAATPRYPWALCIISQHPWASFFYRVWCNFVRGVVEIVVRDANSKSNDHD